MTLYGFCGFVPLGIQPHVINLEFSSPTWDVPTMGYHRYDISPQNLAQIGQQFKRN